MSQTGARQRDPAAARAAAPASGVVAGEQSAGDQRGGPGRHEDQPGPPHVLLFARDASGVVGHRDHLGFAAVAPRPRAGVIELDHRAGRGRDRLVDRADRRSSAATWDTSRPSPVSTSVTTHAEARARPGRARRAARARAPVARLTSRRHGPKAQPSAQVALAPACRARPSADDRHVHRGRAPARMLGSKLVAGDVATPRRVATSSRPTGRWLVGRAPVPPAPARTSSARSDQADASRFVDLLR